MGCHGFPIPQEGLDLRAGNGYADLVDVGADQCAGRQRVTPGQPSNSYLLDKLLGSQGLLIKLQRLFVIAHLGQHICQAVETDSH